MRILSLKMYSVFSIVFIKFESNLYCIEYFSMYSTSSLICKEKLIRNNLQLFTMQDLLKAVDRLKAPGWA